MEENLTKEITEYIDHYGKGVEILSDNELKQIEYYAYKNELYLIEFNKKGHLVFRQRYPNFPLYISIIALVINVIVYIFIFVNM